MNVSYDPGLGVTYVRLVGTAEIARTVSIGDLVMVDVDEHDQPIGVEFLVPPGRISAATIERVVERFPSLKALTETEKWLLTRTSFALPV